MRKQNMDMRGYPELTEGWFRVIFGIMKVYKIIKCAENNFLEEIENGVADIIDNVQRRLGMLPQQANL